LHFLFAWRYFKAKKSTNAINIIAWTSILAIIVGTAALVLVLSVFNGFEGLVKSLYSAFYTDLKVSPASGKSMMVTPAQLQQLKAVPGIRNFSLVVEEKAVLQTKSIGEDGDDAKLEMQQLVHLKGVDDNYRYTTGVAQHLLKGEYDTGDDENPMLILGAGLESALKVSADNNLDPLIIYIPRRTGNERIGENPMDEYSIDTIHLSSSFAIQQDFDNKYGITNIHFLKQALQWKEDEYSGLEISLNDPEAADDIQKELQKIFGSPYLVETRYQQNRTLYSVMRMERWAIYGVACIILIVAAFTMIGALTMLVLEKRKDVSVLHALGASKGFIQRVFLSEGLLLAFIGAGIGMLLGLLIAWAQVKYQLVPLSGGSFLISYFPIKLRAMDFVLVGATVLFIAFIASWFPSRKAAKQDFSLRSE
jgi:lipoprotein-releasing system permease protein